jgi:2-aminoadipate transaminase
MKKYISARALGTGRSAIREILKLTARPEVISFAGGLPDAETFPRDELAKIAADEIKNNYKNVLQYGLTEGSRTLRNAIVDWHPYGLELDIERILITTASQQGLDLVCKAFIDPGDVVFCGLPTYLGAIQTFTLFQADKIGIPLQDDGMDLDVLEQRIAEGKAVGKRLKAIYVVPDFQNPAGITMSLEKRERLLRIAEDADLLIWEDNPYGKLRFTGKPLPPIKSLDRDGRVILLVTFSKLLSAGLRLAFMVAEPEIIDVLVRMKQATDLCTSKLTQHMAARYMIDYGMEEHLEVLRNRYRAKRDAMIAALERYMPEDEGISWTRPEGGLFLWVRLPHGIDTGDMFTRAMGQNVAYVPGGAFYVDGGGQNTMRLCYSVVDEEEIEEGIKRLARVVKGELTAARVGQAG